MNEFLRAYIKEFAYKTLVTDDWKAFLEQFFAREIGAGALKDFDWNVWFYSPGMPPSEPK